MELHVKVYLGRYSEQSRVALQKFLHPEVLQGMLSRRQLYYHSQGSAGPEAAQPGGEKNIMVR